MRDIKRRSFVKGLTVAGAALSLGSLSSKLRAAEDLPIGIQLYTVRDKSGKDFKGTLKKVSDIGFKNFEFAGYGGLDAAELVTFIDEIGVKTCGTHEGYEGLQKNFDSIIEFNQAIGNPYLVVPSMPGRIRSGGVDEIKRFADNLNNFGFKAKQAGIQLAYHNHSFEFELIDGEQTIWDVLFNHADGDMVKAEVDIAWVYNAGVDPVALLETWGSRIKLLHMKDLDADKKLAPVGEGIIDMTAVIKKAKEIGVDWYIVEQDICQRDPFESLSISLRNLKDMGLA